MLQSLADKRRQEIMNGDTKDVPEHEKDLLTLMIEADIRDGSETTSTELRVSDVPYYRHCTHMHNSTTLPSSSWQVITL